MTRFIGIGSGKGGVGKTTTAINLALALHNFGRSVILIDGSLSCPHIALHLGSPHVPKSIHHVLRNRINIKEAAYKHGSGLQLIPGSISVEHQELCDFTKLKEALLDLVGTGEIIIVDMPSSGPEFNHILKSVDDIIIVSTPDMLSATEGLKLKRKAREFGVNVMGIVLNRAEKNDELQVSNTESLFDLPVIGVIPEDKSIKEAYRIRQAVIFSHPDSKSSIAYKELASNIIGELYKDHKTNKTEKEAERHKKILENYEEKYSEDLNKNLNKINNIKNNNSEQEEEPEIY